MTIARAFGRAEAYDAHAGFQRQVADDLAARIAALPLPPAPRVLEIGCGTGFLGAALLDRLPGARWTMTDIAPAMVERARTRFAGRAGIDFAVMDGEAPDMAPEIGAPFDLICSSLAVQWFADLPGAIRHLSALLAPGGWLAVTTLAAGSFSVWQDAHGDLTPGTPAYPDAAMLRAIGLDVAVERIDVPHESAAAFLRALKGIGAGTPRPGHHPLSPAQLRAVMARFEAADAVADYQLATCTLRARGRKAGE